MNLKLNFENFIEFLETKKNISIIGKGKLDNDIPDNKDLYVGIKQSIIICPRKDIFVLNDFEGVFGVEPYFKEIKYIICPYKPHLHWKVCNITYNDVLNYAKKFGFNGKIVVYELPTHKISSFYKKVPEIKSWNSADVILHISSKCTNFEKKIFNTYGICKNVEENKFISDKIKKANVCEKYKKYYKSYIERNYKSDSRNETIKGSHHLFEKKIKKEFPEINIIFN